MRINFARSIAGLAVLLLPLCHSQALNRRIVLGVRCLRSIFQFQEFVNMFGRDGADSVNRIVSGQAFFHQARERSDNRFNVQSQLILDNRMKCHMELSTCPGQRNSRISMVPLDERQPFGFVKSKPFFSV